MAVEPQGFSVFNFPGMRVTIPTQPNPVIVIDKPLPPLSSMPGSDGFTPIRLIANIAVVDVKDNKILTSFEYPIEIAVVYLTLELYEAVRTAKPLKLAYWDVDAHRWVIFTPESHEYTLLAPIDGAIGKVKISSWAGDPPIAWGT